MAESCFYFDDFALDTDRRELRRGDERVALGPQVFDLLAFLVRNRERVVSKDDILEAVWKGRIVSESTLTSHVNAVRKALGDSGEAQRFVRTMRRKGIRFVGEVRETIKLAPSPVAQEQRISFCRAADGVRLAYATVGSGPPLVKTANWMNHLEYDWKSPVWSGFFGALARDRTLVRYDARGNGLSDWNVDKFDFEAFVTDLETVVDAAGLDRFPLLGISQGCAVSIAYAVRHPERVSHLILYGGFARGRRRRGEVSEGEQSDALEVLMRQGWGQENPAFRQIFTSLFMPGGSAEQMQWFNDLQRNTTSPENAVRLRRAVDDIDVSGLLRQVAVPTLVLHVRGDAVQPFERGRELAAEIPRARFVPLEGRNHVPLEGEPSFVRFVDEIRAFLAT